MENSDHLIIIVKMSPGAKMMILGPAFLIIIFHENEPFSYMFPIPFIPVLKCKLYLFKNEMQRIVYDYC